MASSMMMERKSGTMASMPGSGMAMPGMSMPSAMPTAGNWLMVPRCKMKIEKCTGGMKITCMCDDKVACGMLQNLCTMMAGGMCSCCIMMNGMTMCTVNLTMGMCVSEMTADGVCLTCTSGDKNCCDMIQASCDAMCTMMKAGCTCCMYMNQNPLCCGCC